ncbi:MAG TPA: ABC transporter permease [Vicinamibacterales bacterium]
MIESLARMAFDKMTADQFAIDVRGGFKALVRSPGWTAVAILSIALGIGANLLVFAIVDAVLLRPFPYHDPGKLTFLWGAKSQEVRRGISGPDMEDWRRESRSFIDIDAFLEQMSFSVGDGGDTVGGACVGPSVLPILGVAPALGRNFTVADTVGEGRPVVIVSDAFWRARMGASPSVIGSALTLNGRSYQVVGVAPRGFFFPDTNSQILQASPCGMANFRERGSPVMHAIGRLRDGVSLAQAQADLDLINKRLAQAYPDTDRDVTVGLQPIRDVVVGKYERALWLLLAAVGLVLLIACANVAHLQLARGVDRQVELAVRSAIGADRRRLFAQLLTESLVVASAGAACALALAWLGIRVVRSLSLIDIARIDAARVDLRLLVFAAVLALVVTVVAGVWPAWKSAGVHVNDTLKVAAGSITVAPRRAARELLATTELALATVLLVSAGLLVGSFVRLSTARWGFDPQNLFITAGLKTPPAAAASPQTFAAWTAAIRARMRAIPGVDSVGAGAGMPLDYVWSPSQVRVDGTTTDGAGWTIWEGYFHALGTRVIEGREFGAGDSASAQPVAVVSRAFAHRFWPDRPAVGHTFQLMYFRTVNDKIAPDIEARMKKRDRSVLNDPAAWEVAGGITWHVIGVVEDVRAFGLDQSPEPTFYLNFHQAPARWNIRSHEMFSVRTHGNTAALFDAIRNAVASIDPTVQVRSVQSVSELVARSIGGRGSTRLMTLISGLFATLALVLTMSGVFGIVLHTVNQRLPEIGVRMALGADSGDVALLLLSYAGRIILPGIALGTTVAWAVSRLLSSLVFEITPTDPATYVASIALLIACVLVACIVPIRRAMRFDPTKLFRA